VDAGTAQEPQRTAFVSASFRHRAALAPALDALCDALAAAGYAARVFVRLYTFVPDDARAMMDTTQAELRRADLLVAEGTHKAIGVGIEVGYAAALGLPVIYVRHAGAEHSTTVGGIAAHTIVYHDPGDLRRQLADVLAALPATGG
jgi:nucleoside 2-deoxyribosyltransferase